MLLQKLDILNFKNIAESSLGFSSGANCLVGSNGMGKSNLLEAIHYLSFGRGIRSLSDGELVYHGQNHMMLRGHYMTSEADDAVTLDVSIGWSEGKRKQLRRDGKDCRRLSDHIGTIPIVLSDPNDLQLIAGSAEERRRLIDNVISQADGTYLRQLLRYNEALRQRNSMLRQGISDPLLTESVEEQMCEAAEIVMNVRRQWCEDMAEPFARYYSLIAPEEEEASISYSPSVGESLLHDALNSFRRRDEVLGHTSVGPHRDDMSLTLSGYNARRTGSQGQMKSFTVALKLAVFEYLAAHSSTKPLLLLDDIFDKLDAGRVERIVATVTSPELDFGQIFITDTNRKHIDSILECTAGCYRLFGVTDGDFKLLSQE